VLLGDVHALHALASALQAGNIARLLVVLELVAHAVHAGHCPYRAQRAIRLALEDRAAQGDSALVGLDLDRAGMRHHAAERRAHALGEHLVGHIMAHHALPDRAKRADGPVAHIDGDHPACLAQMAQPAVGLVAQHGAPPPALLRIEKIRGERGGARGS
jgi:hypothetical protein